MPKNFDMEKAQEKYMKSKLGFENYEFLTEMAEIERLEGQQTLTGKENHWAINKEQFYYDLAFRIHRLIRKRVRG